MIGNLRTFTALGDSVKLKELEEKVQALGYRNEDNIKANSDTSKKTYHIYDIPRVIEFSVLTEEVTVLLKEYSDSFSGRVGITAHKQV